MSDQKSILAPTSMIILAPTSAGKSRAALEHPIFADGDIIIDQTVGWPSTADNKTAWWQRPDAPLRHKKNAMAIVHWATHHPHRIVLFNGDPAAFPTRAICAAVVPSPNDLLRNVAAKRDRGTEHQPTDDEVVLSNMAQVLEWAKSTDTPVFKSFLAAASYCLRRV